MNDNGKESFTKLKSNKTLETNTSKFKTFLNIVISIFTCIHNIFKWLIIKINTILSSWSILTQMTIILIVKKD